MQGPSTKSHLQGCEFVSGTTQSSYLCWDLTAGRCGLTRHSRQTSWLWGKSWASGKYAFNLVQASDDTSRRSVLMILRPPTAGTRPRADTLPDTVCNGYAVHVKSYSVAELCCDVTVPWLQMMSSLKVILQSSLPSGSKSTTKQGTEIINEHHLEGLIPAHSVWTQIRRQHHFGHISRGYISDYWEIWLNSHSSEAEALFRRPIRVNLLCLQCYQEKRGIFCFQLCWNIGKNGHKN